MSAEPAPLPSQPTRPDFTAKRVQAAYDQLAPIYDAHFQGPIATAEDRIIGEHVRALLSVAPDGLVADLGCGTGLLLKLAPEIRSGHYRGYDLSPRMLDMAWGRNPGFAFAHHDIREPLPDLGGQPIAFLACLFGSASYVPDPLGILRTHLPSMARGAPFFFMLLSPRYRRRKSHIAPRALVYPTSIQHVRRRLQEPWAVNLHARVFGFSPETRLPALSGPISAVFGGFLANLAEKGLRAATELAPDHPAHYFVCVEGVKTW